MKSGGFNLAVNRSNQILIIVMIASFLTPFCGSSLNMSLPDIGREFHAGTSELSWVIETFLLTCAIFTVPMGQLGNRIGKKKVFLIGTILFTLSSLVIILRQLFIGSWSCAGCRELRQPCCSLRGPQLLP